MSAPGVKVGVISCSGEALAEGTISRLATRRVLESLRPGATVTLCLPLFLAGNEAERNFARTHPTIAVDGCAEQCARWAAEKHGGGVSGALVVSDILGTEPEACHRSQRDAGEAEMAVVEKVAARIAAEVDAVLARTPPAPLVAIQPARPAAPVLPGQGSAGDPESR